MEIASSWKLNSGSKDLDPSKLQPNKCLFSPDGQIFCRCQSKVIQFIQKLTFSEIPLTEEITCIATVFENPWILCVGTITGRVRFFDYLHNEDLIEFSPHEGSIQFIKVCSFQPGHFTKPYPAILIQYSNSVVVILHLDQIKNIIDSKSHEIPEVEKYKLLDNREVKDSVIVSSSLSFPLFSNYHQFPAVISVGSPFVQVYYIAAEHKPTITESFHKGIKSIFSFITGQQEEENVTPPTSLDKEWELADEQRKGICLAADPTGRWVAICDNMFRVIIIDAIFGHITKILKGYRDAQIAWFCKDIVPTNDNTFLVIYVPSREIIVVSTIPDGETIAAVKVGRNGRLFQTINKDKKYGVSFLYPTGDVAIINITASPPPREASKNPSDDFHFHLPRIVSFERNETIQNLEKLLLQKSYTSDNLLQLASTIDDADIGAHFISRVVESCRRFSDEQGNDFFMNLVQSICTKLNVEGFVNQNSKEFFDASYSSEPATLATYKILTENWKRYSTFERIIVNDDQYPKGPLTDSKKDDFNNVIEGVRVSRNDEPEMNSGSLLRPSLRCFLENPLYNPMFFFSFIRSSDITIDSLYDAFRMSRENRDNFILNFLYWILKCDPAQILLAQNVISDFFNVKEIRSIAQKRNKNLDEKNANAFNRSALNFFLNV